MPRIRLLDATTANQIAAGEVVERPASVVKELVENSLDAAAGWIRVEIAGGGVDEIRVLDDGEGIARDDLPLAVQRHATSKLTRIEDLVGLKTLGFRGEALPSIASVSRLVVESASDESGEGSRLRIDGGATDSPEAVGHPRGTTVAVRGLFFNAPARRKFLRSPGTETDQIVEVVTRAALAHFDRRFSLSVDGRTLLDVAAVSDRGERVRQIFGGSVAERLVRFALGSGAYRASGFASRPDFTRSNTRDQRLFVNGRPIRDRGLLHAISEAYATLLPARRFPFVLLFLEAPPDRVDHNVHPAKWEVRFAESRVLFDLTRRAIRSALVAERPAPPLAPQPMAEALEPLSPGRTPSSPGAVAERAEGWTFERETPLAAEAPAGPLAPGIGRLSALAQYRDSYIVAADAEGLAIIDQHVAHERVLYEKLLQEAERERVERQSLLFPRTMEVDPLLDRRLAAGRESLGRLGLILEPFGEGSWVIREVPALLGTSDPAALVQDLAEELGREGPGESWDRLRHRLAATTACHAAVKVNFPLTLEKMTYLLNELARTDNPMTCPHGRPIILRIAHRDLEKSFLRK